jgi:hypothetical protein
MAEHDYALIDQHALHAPSQACSSIRALAGYLAGPARTAKEKARAVYTWIAANIEYDDAVYFGRAAHDDGRPETTLKRRKGVCAGYSNLYQSLARAAGLEVATISGHGKGYSYRPGDTRLDTNHDWNALRIDGEWLLLDATWGAGFLGEDRRFEKAFDDFWFLTPPRFFIFSHFPEDEKWQLLPKPITKAVYSRAPHLRSGFFRFGITLASHQCAVIEAESEARIVLTSKAEVLVDSRLESPGYRQLVPLSFCQKEGGAFVVRTAFPSPGEYRLYIFAKKPGDGESSQAIIEYKIKALRGAGKPGYPEILQAFTDGEAELLEPFSGRLQRGTTSAFRLRVPGALGVAVVSGGAWTHLDGDSGLFKGKAFIKAGETIVYAKFEESPRYEGLLRYQA